MIFPYEGKFKVTLPPKSKVIKMIKTPSEHLAIACGDSEGAVDDNNVEAFTIADNWEEDAGPPAHAGPAAASPAADIHTVTTENLSEWTRNMADGLVGTLMEQKYDMLQDLFQAPPTAYALDQQRFAVVDGLKTAILSLIHI